MTTEKENTTLEAIEKLAGIIGESGATITHEYAYWYIWSSVAWICFGIGLMLAARFCKYSEDFSLDPSVVKFALYIAGGVFIAANIGDLFGSPGIAIHRLILDIRG